MESFLLIGAGGFAGANVRFFVSIWAARRFGPAFPIGTLIANSTGCFLMGLLLGILSAEFTGSSNARLLLAIGFLGSETTFSTYAYETVALIGQRDARRAAINVVGGSVLGLGAASLGLIAAWALTGGA